MLLLDEPLSNLDAKLREEMRNEIRELQQRSGITTVFVTHDQGEALTMSDRVAVMQRGRVDPVREPAGDLRAAGLRRGRRLRRPRQPFRRAGDAEEGNRLLIAVDGPARPRAGAAGGGDGGHSDGPAAPGADPTIAPRPAAARQPAFRHGAPRRVYSGESVQVIARLGGQALLAEFPSHQAGWQSLNEGDQVASNGPIEDGFAFPAALIAVTGRRTAAPARAGLALSTPILLLVGLCFVVPLALIARISFYPAQEGGVLLPGVTLDSYADFIGDPFYHAMILRSVLLSLLITAIALVLTYPIALFLHRLRSRWRPVLIVVTVSPLLVSAVVRTYGWMIILGDNGWVNAVLRLWDCRRLQLANNYTGVVIGMIEIMMPYMALALIVGFGRIDATLEEAAATPGGAPAAPSVAGVVPLSLPGVGLGLHAVFRAHHQRLRHADPAWRRAGLPDRHRDLHAGIGDLNWPLASAMAVLMLVAFTAAMGCMAGPAGGGSVRDGRLAASPGSATGADRGALPFLLAPVFPVVMMSFTNDPYIMFPPQSWGVRWYQAIWYNDAFQTAMRLSLVVGIAATAIGVVTGLPAAYAIARLPLVGRDVLLALFTGAADRADHRHRPWAAADPGADRSARHLYRPDRQPFGAGRALRRADRAHRAVSTLPADVEAAAATLGATPLRVFRRVTLPLSALPSWAPPAVLPGLVRRGRGINVRDRHADQHAAGDDLPLYAGPYGSADRRFVGGVDHDQRCCDHSAGA